METARNMNLGPRRRAVASLALVLAVRLGVVGVASLEVVSFTSAAAAAPSASGSAQARSLFREARQLMDKKRFAEACPKLQESLRIDPGMGTQFNLAHCWEQLGLTASAWGMYLDVAAAAQGSGQVKRETAAREKAAALEPKLSRLRIDVVNPAQDMTIRRAGEEVGQGAWATDMPIDPGTYRIEASAPDKRPWSTEVVIEKPGATVAVTVPALEDVTPVLVEAPEPGAAPEPVSVEDKGGGSGRTIATVALAAVGVGGVVAGVIYGLDANDHTNSARDLCTGGPEGTTCLRDQGQPSFDDGVAEREELLAHRDSADRSALISYVAFGVGGAALVGATLLLITGSSGGDSPEPTNEARLTPAFSPDFAGVSLSGHF